MKPLLAMMFGLLLTTPALVRADDSSRPGEAAASKDARLVPAMKDDVFVGFKVYAIRAGGRFDQPQARFLNGDTIESIDGAAVTTTAGSTALHDKVILGTADAVVTVRRNGQLVTLASKSVR